MLPTGLLLLHKQPGITSFDSLRDVKRALGTGKVGHTGTLDKFAEGLLLILIGRALKLSRWFTHCDKQYEGTICFGSETDTLDPEGTVIANAPLPSREAVEQALSQFTGEILQAPPAYSAIHIDGERASALARQGRTPEMQKRPVTIYRLELRSWEPPFAKIFVHCSSGTYIRSLARDIALAVGSCAHLSALVRTKVAGFRLEEAFLGIRDRGSGIGDVVSKPSVLLPRTDYKEQPQSLVPDPQSLILPIDGDVFEKLGIPCIEVNHEDAKKIFQGKSLVQILGNIPLLSGKGTTAAVFSGDTFLAMIEFIDNKWKYGYVNASN